MAGYTKTLDVRFHDGRLVGRLLHNGPVYFAYDKDWLASHFDISPLSLPFSEKPFNCQADGCEGVPGVIADALPDAWGRKIADAVFAKEGWGLPTTMKLLSWIGARGTGALSFEPPAGQQDALTGKITAAALAREARAILRGDPKAIIPALASGGTAGGAYPKALVMSHADGSLSLARTPAAKRDVPSILKLSIAPNLNAAAIEHACGLMARAAGVNMAESELLEDKDGHTHLLIRRFDFDKTGHRRHMHSLSGLLHRPKAGLDYADFFRAVARLSNRDDLVEAARRMVFNLYAGNDDDHGRNHAFLYDESAKRWMLSPAFDITHAPGALTRGMTILNEVRPAWEKVSAWLATAGMGGREITTIRNKVRDAVANWGKHAQAAGVPRKDASRITDTLAELKRAIDGKA